MVSGHGKRRAVQRVQRGAGKEVEVAWTNSVPDHGEAYFLVKYFFPLPDALMLTRPIAKEVLNYVRPDDRRACSA